MKRHESIVVLSRDHHFGLLFCWKIRTALKKNIALERIRPYVSYFWDNHLKHHFEEEETLLFALLQDELCKQAISEHNEIRRHIEAIAETNDVSANALVLLADSLDNHIRFEERVLFPHIEKNLSEEVLAGIGNQLVKLHETHEKDTYQDEFWV